MESKWTDREKGPECFCGCPTFVTMMDGHPHILCLFHTGPEGAMFPLPKARKPETWPNISHDEIKKLVEEGIAELKSEGKWDESEEG